MQWENQEYVSIDIYPKEINVSGTSKVRICKVQTKEMCPFRVLVNWLEGDR